jgi:hypothetical protein
MLHMLDRQGVFLARRLEAHQLHVLRRTVRPGSRGIVRGAAMVRHQRLGHRPALAALLPGQPLRVQDHDHPELARPPDDPAQEIGTDRGVHPRRRLDLAELGGDHRRHPVHHQPGRHAAVQHHHPRRIIAVLNRIVENPPQAGHRHHRAAQIRQALKRPRAQRHMHQIGHPDDLLHLRQRHRENPLLDMKGHKLSRIGRNRLNPIASVHAPSLLNRVSIARIL